MSQTPPSSRMVKSVHPHSDYRMTLEQQQAAHDQMFSDSLHEQLEHEKDQTDNNRRWVIWGAVGSGRKTLMRYDQRPITQMKRDNHQTQIALIRVHVVILLQSLYYTLMPSTLHTLIDDIAASLSLNDYQFFAKTTFIPTEGPLPSSSSSSLLPSSISSVSATSFIFPFASVIMEWWQRNGYDIWLHRSVLDVSSLILPLSLESTPHFMDRLHLVCMLTTPHHHHGASVVNVMIMIVV
jgi:hypothetical protein